MKEYLISENMKIKHTFLRKLIVIAPMLTMLLALGLTYNYYEVDSYNWWYMIMLPGSLAISCVLLSKVDSKMKNKGVLNMPLDLKKVWVAKVLVGVKNLAISCMMIFAFTNVLSLIFPMKSVIDIPFISGFCGILVLIITFMWQIPLLVAVGEKIGMSLTIIISFGCNLIFSALAIKDYWFAIPFSYPARLMCPILKILPNGLLAVPESATFKPELLSYSSIAYGVNVSIILFIIFTYVTAKRFAKKEAV